MKKTLMLLMIVLGCCDIQHNDQTQNVATSQKAAPTDISYCKSGCEYLATLHGQDGKDGCLESRTLQFPDLHRQSCEEFCIATLKEGKNLNPKCWTTLQSCDEIEACRKD